MMRQRLVGALVLLCGGIILWSLLFTGPAASKLDRKTQIPDAPLIDPVIDTPPLKPEDIMSADTLLVPEQPNMPIADEDEGAIGAAVRAEADNIPDPADSQKKSVPVAKSDPLKVEKDLPAKPAVAKRLDANGLPKAWVVQIGVFGIKANAEGLRKSLQGAGYKAFIDEIQRNSKSLYRVLVGPVISNEKAVTQQAAINKRFNVKSIVNRFEP
jgi:DedD protein